MLSTYYSYLVSVIQNSAIFAKIIKSYDIMHYFSLIGLIFVIHLLAVMSPGPDFVLILKNALQYNRKTAVYTALGIAIGIGIHILYSVAGVAYLLQKNNFVFNAVKIIGALYIIYLGINTLKTKSNNPKLEDNHLHTSIKNSKAIKTGFLTNVLNPKASLFFLSIFSILIPPNTPNYILLIISTMLIIVTFLWFTFISYIFTHHKFKKSYQKYERYILKTFGIILILLGISIFFEL